MRRLWYYYFYLLITWGSFRYFVRLPDVIEELWFKPLIWLVPLFWWNLALPTKVEMFGKGWARSVLWGLMLGLVYFVLVRKFTLGWWWSIEMFGVALATAVTEELVFSGFIAGYLLKTQRGHWVNWLILGVMVIGVRIPLLLFVHRLGVVDMFGVLLLAGAAGMINAWIRIRTGNVAGSILARLGMILGR